MDIFNLITLIGGICLFLFGMHVMGDALERRAGGSMRTILEKMTTKKMVGFLTGCGVTSIIQSSSATIVMVVGFVNSGLMTLSQSINVIMGANVGTTITGWILSLNSISGENIWLKFLQPSSFTPILALIGIILLMNKSAKKKDTGCILLGFATLMFGMETMSSAVSGLKSVPAFSELFIMFKSPLLGVLVGIVVTAAIQSSSASVGVLQAMSVTGQVSYGAAVPFVMGAGIGACITSMIAAIGANKNGKRAAFANLIFNLLGTGFWMIIYCVLRAIFMPDILDKPATLVGIAIFNTIFRVLCTVILLPATNLLERIVYRIIPGKEDEVELAIIDERLIATPPVALARCHEVAIEMAYCSVRAYKYSILSFTEYTDELAKGIRKDEDLADQYEDALGSFLVKLSAQALSREDSEEVTELLKVIGDFERISDHAVNILECAEEMRSKKFKFSPGADKEMTVLSDAVTEIINLATEAFVSGDTASAILVEPLEQVIDNLKDELRTRHILRMQNGKCSIEAGFIWGDLLTNLERISDHCSNIGGCILDTSQHNLNIHETLREMKTNSEFFSEKYRDYAGKYILPSYK